MIDNELDALYLQHVLDEVPVMVWVSDTTKACIMFNRHWLAFTGRTAEQEYGAGWAEGVHPDDLARCIEIYEGAFDAREPFQMEYRLRHHSGEYRWISDHGQPRHSSAGTFLGYFGTGVDLTVQRAAEAENSRLRHELEQARRLDPLGRLATTLAHEFNNVLMSIAPFAELLLRDDLKEAGRVAAATHIRNAMQRGKRITSDIMRFTKPAELKLEPLELCSWLRTTVDSLRPLAGSAALRLECDDEQILILADPEQLEQALSNLITNARDALIAHPAGEIKVTVTFGEQGPELSVRDNGAGIAPEVLPHIFEPLFTTKRNRTGLGLAVVRAIAERHGHPLALQTTLGEGTTVTIKLSLCSPGRPPADVGERTRAADILLIEDEIAIAAGLEALLADAGFVVTTAATGASALEEIDRRHFDAVILDLGLPDLNGTVVLGHVRAMHPGVPVVISTGHGVTPLEKRELDHCALVAHLLKPYEFATLLRTLDRLIRESRSNAAPRPTSPTRADSDDRR